MRFALSRPSRAFAVALISACTPASPMDTNGDDVPLTASLVAAAESGGLARVSFPESDPGIPAYARLGAPLNQIFHDDQWLVIPFYRDPGAIRGDFDLLSIFDFPGPGGPGAFGVPLTITGFFMIEQGAPLGTFPRLSVSKGSAVPVWFVNWPAARAAMADHVLTMDELRALSPIKGTASSFTETLRPRDGEHLVVLNARGTTTDGRRFGVHITHVEDRTTSQRITLR